MSPMDNSSYTFYNLDERNQISERHKVMKLTQGETGNWRSPFYYAPPQKIKQTTITFTKMKSPGPHRTTGEIFQTLRKREFCPHSHFQKTKPEGRLSTHHIKTTQRHYGKKIKKEQSKGPHVLLR